MGRTIASDRVTLPMNDDIEFPAVPAGDLLAQIDAQQDDLLSQLDDLNSRLEALLATCGGKNLPSPSIALSRSAA